MTQILEHACRRAEVDDTIGLFFRITGDQRRCKAPSRWKFCATEQQADWLAQR